MRATSVACRIRPVTFRTIIPLVLSLSFVSACSGSAAQTSKNPVDVSDLVPRERALFERMLDELYAPCADVAVTLDVCLQEKRSCNACAPAANFLVKYVKAGLSKNAIRTLYKMRFSDTPKQVDLADSPTLGPATAPVTIVVWSDFECPSCGHMVPIIERLVQEHDKDVRLVHKFYPIPKHTHAKQAARIAWAAQQQGKYWEMERLLFENQRKLGEQTMLELAASLSLNMDRVKTDMESEGATKAIERDVAEAEKHGLMGTPFILINGREFDLSLFKAPVEPDLEAWVTIEIEMVRGK